MLGPAGIFDNSFISPYPWSNNPQVTNAWIADPQYLTFSNSGVQNGVGISTWAPQKGAFPLIQPIDGYQPILKAYGSKNITSISLDGVNDFMQANGFGVAMAGTRVPFTACISIRNNTAGLMVPWSLTNTTGPAHEEIYVNGGKWTFDGLGDSGGPSAQVVNSPLATLTPVILTVSFTGTFGTFRLNGAVTNINGTLHNISIATFDTFCVGNAKSTSYYNGQVRAVVFGQSVWSNQTLNSVESYLLSEF